MTPVNWRWTIIGPIVGGSVKIEDGDGRDLSEAVARCAGNPPFRLSSAIRPQTSLLIDYRRWLETGTGARSPVTDGRRCRM